MSLTEESSVDPVAEECEITISGKERKLDSAKDVEDTVKAIKEAKGLTTLRLSGNSMGVQAAQAIAGGLATQPTLTRALWSNMFVSRLRAEIPPALTCLSEAVMAASAQLVELDLSDNAFGPVGLQAIFQLLTSPACHTLRVLKLNNTGIGVAGGELLAEALSQCHDEACREGGRLQLEVFVLGRSRLENKGASALAKVFGDLSSLLEVSMPQNGINKEGISALATAFAKNTQLRSIDLNDNTFTEEGAVAMAAVLPSLQELRSINFGDCLLRPGGGSAIAAALHDGHRKLEELCLGYNSLNQSSAIKVAEALSNKTELRKLDLNGQRDLVTLVKEMVDVCVSLCGTGNCLGESGSEALREVLEAKGLADCLESLSDDEGTDSEGEEDQEHEGEQGEEKEGEGEGEEGEGEGEEGEAAIERKATSSPEPQVSVEDFLCEPSGHKLLSLGSKRAEIVANTLGTTWSGEEAGRLYVKVASCYSDTATPDLRSAVEETIDAVAQPVCEAGKTAQLLNEILVQLGLLKSEDKEFQPVQEVDGPILALAHLARQSYFPKHSIDTLITFIQKPHPQVTPTARPKVLQALYSV